MKGRFGSRGKVAIVGFAQSKVYRKAPIGLGAMTLDACARAIEDAGLKRQDIDGLSTAPTLPATGVHTTIDGIDVVSTKFIAEHLGIVPRWFNNYTGMGQISSSMAAAVNAVASGACDYALLHRALHNPPGRYQENPMTRAAGASQWTAPFGIQMSGPGTPPGMALIYNEYMQRYGATREEMATLIVQIRSNVQQDPESYWYKNPLTRQDYLDSRRIADSISILDCDIPVDFAAAFVLTTADRARDLKNKPVYVAGYVQGQQPSPVPHPILDDIIEGGKRTAKTLWDNSGFTAKDIDVPQVYDGFSPFVYFWLETLGFCPVGEAHRFIQGGAIDVNGKFPLLSGGGSLGHGRVHGIAHIRECYLQLAQRAGPRQLRKATVGVACHAYPDYGGASVYTSESLS